MLRARLLTAVAVVAALVPATDAAGYTGTVRLYSLDYWSGQVSRVGTSSSWSEIDAGWGDPLAVRQDGTLWRVGYPSAPTATRIGSSSNWRRVSVGTYFNLALRTDGSLWAWGDNTLGQLGLGAGITSVSSPQRVGTAKNWVSISAGNGHSLALRSDGSMWAWGFNRSGQLGYSTTTPCTGDPRYTCGFTPRRVGTATSWSMIAAGSSFSLALRSNHTLWAWGDNEYGQLGLGDTSNRSSPQRVGNASDWTFVTAGSDHAAAIRGTGTLWTWGLEDYFVLGYPAPSSATIRSPQRVGTVSTWRKVWAGPYYNYAIRTDGSLWRWGCDSEAETCLLTPHRLGTGSSWLAVSVGYDYDIALART